MVLAAAPDLADLKSPDISGNTRTQLGAPWLWRSHHLAPRRFRPVIIVLGGAALIALCFLYVSIVMFGGGKQFMRLSRARGESRGNRSAIADICITCLDAFPGCQCSRSLDRLRWRSLCFMLRSWCWQRSRLVFIVRRCRRLIRNLMSEFHGVSCFGAMTGLERSGETKATGVSPWACSGSDLARPCTGALP
jgi:hypothetical protein